MEHNLQEKILSNPHFKDLVSRRSALAWRLSMLTLIIYYGFILLIAFAPAFLGMPLGEGVMTLGIPVGLGIIFFAFIVTGIYVKRANTEFDDLTKAIKEDARSHA